MTCPRFTYRGVFVGEGGDYIFSGFGETNCGYLQNFTDQKYEWFLMLHQQKQEIPDCCCAPQTSTCMSLSVTSSGVLRSACCCFQSSTRTPVRTPLSMTTTWYMIPHLTYFPFLHRRTLTVRPCCQFSVPDGT